MTIKYIAKSLRTILEHPVVTASLDKQKDILPVLEEVSSWWTYDLYSRKPAPAYTNMGVFQGTDLDMACFLFALVDRNAVIRLPTYSRMTGLRKRSDQIVIDNKNRHGTIINLYSNKHFFSFGILILDQNVVGYDKVGYYRKFAITDRLGNWYKGWRELRFVPTIKENQFILENEICSDNKVIFKNFIHPNRWISLFGHYYVVTKILLERIDEELKFLNREIKRLRKTGIRLSKTPQILIPEREYKYGKTKSVKFSAYEFKIYLPEKLKVNDFPKFEETKESLRLAYQRRRTLDRYRRKLQFMTRATEFAHIKRPNLFPSWIKGTQWEPDFVEKGKRTKWHRLKLFQPEVGEFSVSVLKRTFMKTARVPVD